MKLAIHNGSRVWGGNEKWLTTLAVGLRERGHDVVVSCRAGAPPQQRLEREGVPTSPIRPGGELDVLSHLRFARWLREVRPETLLLTSWNRTPAAVRAARWAGVPRVVVRLGIVRSLPARGRYTRVFRTGVDALIVNSSEIREEWLRSAPWFPPEAVHVIFNGISVPEVPPQGWGDALHRELGLEPDVRLVAVAGHVTHRKGFDLLLRALARIDDPRLHGIIIGSGPEERSLQQLADDLGIAARVHWLGFRADVLDVIAGCDAFVLSSRNEGMANVMLEAMATGVPVVAAEISGVREALGKRLGRGDAGWVIPPDDPETLASTLSTIVDPGDDYRAEVSARVAEAGYRVRTWFNPERMVEAAERVLFPEPQQ